ncbi:MAG: hypothetical protein CMJ48_09450 [Planctomycetaceae bacterium]|nr:hypothetical protein [Planctomycetaceae bacterium]
METHARTTEKQKRMLLYDDPRRFSNTVLLKDIPYRSFRVVRSAVDPATHRFEQSRRAPFVVAIASVAPPGGPYRWR